MKIDANLVIRCNERGAFEVSLVPAGLPSGDPAPIVSLADPDALEKLLADLGLAEERIAQILRSPYVLQSQRVRVDRRAAERLGLLPTTGLRHTLGRLAQAVTEPGRLVRLMTRRPPGDDRP